MAKSQHRSNREKRKPKADKSKVPAAQASPLSRSLGTGSQRSGAAKKGR
jgi:hypothetical protein